MRKKVYVFLAAVAILGATNVGNHPTKALATVQTGVVATPETGMESPHEVEMSVVDTFSEENEVAAVFSQKLYLPKLVDGKRGEEKGYFKFTLKEDSWVYFTGGYALNNHDGLSTTVQVFSDSAYSNKKLEVKWGYFAGKMYRENTAVLPAGTYYGYVFNKHENFGDFDGSVNVKAIAIPVDKMIKAEQTLGKKKDKAEVSLTVGLGKKAKLIQYRMGKVGSDSANKEAYWGKISYDSYQSSRDELAAALTLNDDNNYKFEAKKNGYYTVAAQDVKDVTVFSTIHVTGIDDVKPKIKGVKNKRVYQGSVTVKFSDKGSGVRSATLNGLKVKSGKKITLPGTYKLVVKDKAGNVNRVSFKVVKK